MRRRIKNQCLYCDYTNSDIVELKEHERKIHGCFRDINPRKAKRKKVISSKEPDKIDWVYKDSMKIKNTDEYIDVYHIWDTKRKDYRIFTNELLYSNFAEILFDNERLAYVVKNIKNIKKQYKETKVKVDTKIEPRILKIYDKYKESI